LRDTFDNQEKFDTSEDLRTWLKIRVGHYIEYITPEGEVVYAPKSMDFERMGQVEFEAFYDATIELMEQLVPGVSDEA